MILFGASGGIGSALSRSLAQTHPKAHLIFAADDGQALEALVGSLGKGEAHKIDATKGEQVQNVVEGALLKYGRLDAVASMVGNVMMKPSTGSPEEPRVPQGSTSSITDLEDALRINLYTSFNVVQYSAKAMQKNGGGSIVLTSAAVAERGVPHFEALSAAKAGVEGMARSFAASYVRQGVRINCVLPGLTRTKQTEGLTRGESRPAATSKQMHPVKHFADPADIAAALEFFMDPRTDFITGQCLAVDGGLSSLTLQN
ncbi:hypothetical protein DUNSADRAFT_13991 [Dunaliella salina]|uniref:Uncharacterized protein n=1 Tax=Dunaliella salina TaxID=3046 RepID=A0ABQ7G875_DUNSA|nr:hypothetical protein DUNSADRAFT_13991 [Dunaliella salina]|eukprot:KAF5830801.1 hypothetical protein DUNSADRAFT_13991 [Dunaliella salina]